MSIKKLFDSTNRNYLSNTTTKDAFKNVESSENVSEIKTKQETFIPAVDYSEPENFVKYGSAYLYYKAAMEQIYDYYPYDGSDAEINKFYNDLLDIEKYIFDNRYPRTNGYALLSADGWGSLNGSIDNGYGTPSSLEHITFYGGPHTSSYTKLSDAFPSDAKSIRQASNVYDEDIYTSDSLPSDYGTGTRQSNLRSNFDTGVTIEFWLKKAAFDNTKTEKEVIFDMWNNGVSGSATYGRLRVELTGAASGSPFLITAQSASSGFLQQSIGQSLTTASLETFSHYAVTFYNSGSNIITELYVNGALNDTNTTAGSLNELNSKNMTGRIGALLTASVDAGNVYGAPGAGKLSASLDEFRFWKARRNGEDIGLNWRSQVRGGVNTDISNTTLGVYYKFNEGITGESTIDDNVLDYSGRLSNGTWTGYDTYSRSTASAFVESGNRTSEYLDPIIYSTHPSVSSLRTDLLAKGENFDLNNNSAFVNLMPSWILAEADDKEDELKLISHIVASYMDKLSLQIESVPNLKNLTYTSSSVTPTAFARNMAQSLGLYMPEIFVDANVLEKFSNRTEDTFLESDLIETKNLIYLNIFNNLSNIYKSKGTEKSIKNILRCFNLDDRVLKLRTYSDNSRFFVEDKLVETLSDDTSINFGVGTNCNGVIYQAADPSNAESFAFISGTYEENKEDRYGFSLETGIIFPFYVDDDQNFDRNFTDVSLFGMNLANTSSASDTTWASNDPVNFQVYAIRPKNKSKNVYFKLTSSISPNPFPELTSSLFFNVYDNNQWNFSVRLKPSNFPVTDIVTGSDAFTYDLEFRGINAISDNIQNSFVLTSSVSQTVGSNFLKSAKRIYGGARRTNITGALQQKSDVLLTNVKYWLKYIDDQSINSHLYDINNAGVSGSYKNVSSLDSNLNNTDVTNYNTLALHWTFDNVPTAYTTASVYVNDMSSGSAEIRSNYGWIGGISGYQYNGVGFGFDSSNGIAKKDKINSLKFVDPEQVVSSDMVSVFSDEKRVFGTNNPPIRFFHSLEKSMYNSISEEMLVFFAGVIDFNDLIGAPVNRYRERYKDLEKLKETFFRKVTNTSTVEKFINYYKWLDDSISQIITQILPYSSGLEANVADIIESHVLERNKYQSKFPSLTSYASTEGPAMGINKHLYGWKFGHAPISDSQSDNTLWWKERAIRSDASLSSGDTTVDSERETIREIANKVNNQTASVLTTVNRATYNASVDILRKRARPYKFDVIRHTTIKGGVNFEPSKDIHLTYNALAPAGPVNTENDVFVPRNVLFAPTADLQDLAPVSNDIEDPNKKIKRHFKVQHGRDWEEGVGYYNVKSSFIFPFNVFSSSVTTGYNAEVVAKVSGNLQITNVHNDVYGPDMEVPMQGPFTDYAVGGHQSRHIRINQGSDNYLNRPEAWKIVLGTCESYNGVSGAIGMVGADYPYPEANAVNENPYPMTGAQKAVYYRDHVAKRPVNIRNILMRTGSTILGNYSNNYEVASTVGGYSNPRAFIDNQPTLPTQITQTPSASQARSILDIRRTDQNHFEFVPDYAVNYLHDNANNKSVIRSRFSAPGSVEVLGQGYGDIRSNDFSVYNSINYRNLTVRRPFQHISGTVSEATGSGTTGIRVSDQNGNDFGLVRNLSAHAGKFGRDNTVTNPGASYEQAAAFIKVNRNRTRKITQNANGTFTTSSKFDNFYVQHAIPRSDKQYAWITGSLAAEALSGDLRYEGYMPVNGPQAGYYATGSGLSRRYVAFFDFVSASDAKVGSLYQPAMGLNIYVDEPVDSLNDNNLGLPLNANVLGYYNTDLLGPLFSSLNQDSDYFNLLMAKRKSVFGFRGSPQIGPSYHPILRKHRKENTFSFSNSPLQRYSFKPITQRAKSSLANYDVHTFDDNGNITNTDNVTLNVSFDNKNQYFSNDELNQKLLSDIENNDNSFDVVVNMKDQPEFNLNWVVYSEQLFPTKLNEYTTASYTRVGYDNLYWRATQGQRISLHDDSIVVNSFNVAVSQSSWVLDAPLGFLTRSINDLSFIGTNNVNLLRLSNSAGELQNEYEHVHRSAAPIPEGTVSQNVTVGALFARKHLVPSASSVVSPSGIAISQTGSATTLVELYGGEAVWEAGAQAGYVEKSGSSNVFVSHSSEPWFSNYDDYKYDLGITSKNYAVVPEFRISENIEDYEKLGINSSNKFDTFEIVGTNNNSSNSNFYKDFSNSDFMRNFTKMQDKTGLLADEIMLVCSASIRFNPYKGFYPAQRTVDLVEQFRKSYGNSIEGKSGNITAPQANKGTGRPIAQSLFAPGILYNTIKSGIAVDFPIVTSRDKFKKTYYGSATSASEGVSWMIAADSTSSAGQNGYLGGQYWDYRIPFEAIIEPETYISNLNFYDMEPHPSASLNVTSSLSPTNIDNIYFKMASNFFGEMSRFFLKDESYTKLESNVIDSDLKFKSGDVYGARIKIRRSVSGSRTYLLESGSSGNNLPYGANGAKFYNSSTNTFTSGAEYQLPQHPRLMGKGDFAESFTLYSRPTAFGPEVSGRPEGASAVTGNVLLSNPIDSINGMNPAFTPPYYDGEAWLDLVFRPSGSVSYDLQRILSEIDAVSWRFDAGVSASAAPAGSTTNFVGTQIIPTFSGNIAGQGDMIYDGKNINYNCMHLTNSINVFGVERVEKVRKDAFGNESFTENETVGSRWVIQPKTETPMPNYGDKGVRPVSFSVPTYASASVPRGVWHQFGVIEPDPKNGLFLEIEEIPTEWLKYHYDVIDNNTVYNNFSAANNGGNLYKEMKSLVDVFGFNKTSKKMGQFKSQATLKEAIVAVPYKSIVKEGDSKSYNFENKSFFGIDRETINACLSNAVGTANGDSTEFAGISIRNLVTTMQEYVLPPQFDFVNNKNIEPMAMYFFEFEYQLDSDDLNYIWQNLAPIDYKQITKQSVAVAHKLGENELLTREEFIDENTRWMIFKVKQRGQTEYKDTVVSQVGQAKSNREETNMSNGYPVSFNWPYDYVSFVESIKLDAQALYKNDDENEE
jgi:hypothetical protein